MSSFPSLSQSNRPTPPPIITIKYCFSGEVGGMVETPERRAISRNLTEAPAGDGSGAACKKNPRIARIRLAGMNRELIRFSVAPSPAMDPTQPPFEDNARTMMNLCAVPQYPQDCSKPRQLTG